MAISTRQATTADAVLISSLNCDVQALHAAAMPWRFKPPGPDTFPPSSAAALLALPDHLVFIAEVSRDPAGYAYAEIVRRPETPFHYAHDLVHLHHISVRPGQRRSGVGRALIGAVRAAAEAEGIDLLTLDVWSFNEHARAFFCREGFAPYIERMWSRQP